MNICLFFNCPAQICTENRKVFTNNRRTRLYFSSWSLWLQALRVPLTLNLTSIWACTNCSASPSRATALTISLRDSARPWGRRSSWCSSSLGGSGWRCGSSTSPSCSKFAVDESKSCLSVLSTVSLVGSLAATIAAIWIGGVTV